MRISALALNFSVLLISSVVAQDAGLGTPAITPPMLSQPNSGNQTLIVPPNTQPAATQAPAAPAQATAPVQEVAQGAVERSKSSETFRDWTLECFEPAYESGACQITHRVLAGASSQVVMVFALSTTSEAVPGNVQMALPLGISLPSGVRIGVGDGYQGEIAIQRCTPQGCIVEGAASAELIDAMRKGATGTITVHNQQDQPVQFPFSLAGFTAAYAAMIAPRS